MIISCPECSGPFELQDNRIADLVQIECPNCKFRMILDFAAANDAKLIEDGMRMASGFRSAADYFASVAPAAAPAAEPALAPVPEPAEEVPAAAARIPPTAVPAAAPKTGVPAPTRPTRTKTVVGPFPAPPPAQGPHAETGESAELDELDYEDEPPTALHQVAETPGPGEEVAPEPVPLPAVESTQVAPAPDLPPYAAVSAASRATVEVDPPIAEAAAKSVERAPPHTPPTRASTSIAADSDPVPVPAPMPSPSDTTDLEEAEHPQSSPAATFLLVVLLVLVVALVGASVALKSTPDPRPLLEDLFR